LTTLVLQGLSITGLIKYLKISDGEKESQRIEAMDLRIRLAESVLTYLDINYLEEIQKHETYKRVRDRYERMIEISKRKLESDEQKDEDVSFLPQYREMLIELVHIRRRELMYMRYKGEFSEELIREREWELDLEEARLKN